MELEAASRVHTRSGRLNSTRQHGEPHRSKSKRHACGPSRMGTFKHIDAVERNVIHRHLYEGRSHSWIAAELYRRASAVSRGLPPEKWSSLKYGF